MRALKTIKRVCNDVLKDGRPESIQEFHTVVDAASVLEMATAIELLLTYTEKLSDLTAQELTREIRHRMSGNASEGGV